LIGKSAIRRGRRSVCIGDQASPTRYGDDSLRGSGAIQAAPRRYYLADSSKGGRSCSHRHRCVKLKAVVDDYRATPVTPTNLWVDANIFARARWWHHQRRDDSNSSHIVSAGEQPLAEERTATCWRSAHHVRAGLCDQCGRLVNVNASSRGDAGSGAHKRADYDTILMVFEIALRRMPSYRAAIGSLSGASRRSRSEAKLV